jgi:hypothetical protein
LCNRQREATELQLEELQREIEGLDLAYTQTERSKHALEERLTEQVNRVVGLVEKALEFFLGGLGSNPVVVWSGRMVNLPIIVNRF